MNKPTPGPRPPTPRPGLRRRRDPLRWGLRLSLLALPLLALPGCGPSDGGERGTVEESEADLVARARAIHERVITHDTHDDINPANFTAERNYTQDLPTQVTLPKMEAGGLDVAWFVVYVGQGLLTEDGFDQAYEQAVEKFDAIHRLTEEIAPDRIGLALTSDDVESIVGEGKLVAMIGVENGYPIGMDAGRVREFAERGARYMSLAHNGHSQLADSNTGERDDVWLHGGLSELGREVVAEMNRWGIMIDVSHPSKAANLETIRLSRAPVMASHSSARALSDVSRNLDDEELAAIAASGGVVQTVAFGSYLDVEKYDAHQAARRALENEIGAETGFEVVDRGTLFSMTPEEREEYLEAYAPIRAAAEARIDEVDAVAPPVDVGDFVDHIDYLVQTMGLEHVGISSDFDGGGGVKGWMDASETFNVTLELVRRGYTEEEIAMLWGGNLMRVLDEVQAVAKEIQAEES